MPISSARGPAEGSDPPRPRWHHVRTEIRDRLISGVGAVAVTGLLGALLVAGLTVDPQRLRQAALAVIDVPLPPPPPEPKPPKPVHGYRAALAAGAPAPRAKAVPVVVPPPIVPLPLPPVVAAPRPATGPAVASGASTRGTGTGAAGEGEGPGGGGDGGAGDDVPPVQIAGRVKPSDLPEASRESRTHWLMREEYEVGIDGRARNCRTIRSSGDMAADDAVCDAILKRYRFRPARDGSGRPFVSTFNEYHEWTIERERGDDPSPR